MWRILGVVLLGLLMSGAVLTESPAPRYWNQWAVAVEGGREVASLVAGQHGFRLQESHTNLPDHAVFLFRHDHAPASSHAPSPALQRLLEADPRVTWAQQQVSRWLEKRSAAAALGLNDPDLPLSWHLLQESPTVSMNIQRAWRMGYSGRGVNVSVVDDGVYYDHPDLAPNYEAANSQNVLWRLDSPRPFSSPGSPNDHGTRCAGIIAAAANNSVCGAGVAFGARVSGVLLVSSGASIVHPDLNMMIALAYASRHVDIYSCSWHLDTNHGQLATGGGLTSLAFRSTTMDGRGGKGCIYVTATGNGGRSNDCNADDFTSSIYAVAVGAVARDGRVPRYAQHCAAALAAAFSRSSDFSNGILSPTVDGRCDSDFGGTSASAALASGVLALALEANPALSWRDVQHLVVMAANPPGVRAPDWRENGAGRRVSHFVGYGLLDAAAMVTLARNWSTVPPGGFCSQPLSIQSGRIPGQHAAVFSVHSTGCQNSTGEDDEDEVNFLEHVTLCVSLRTTLRGGVEILLTSPMGSTSRLLARRRQDRSREGFLHWQLTSSHFWGEDPRGVWRLEVRSRREALLQRALLRLQGSREEPYPGARRRQEQGWARLLSRASAAGGAVLGRSLLLSCLLAALLVLVLQ